MNLKIEPSSRRLEGVIRPPTSKSYTIRAVIIAALGGKSRIINPSDCQDSKAALNAARSFGAKIKKQKSFWKIDGIKAINPKIKTINVKESGTTLRFILPLTCLANQEIIINGQGTLRTRPNQPLVSVLKKMGAQIKAEGIKQAVPIFIRPSMLRAGKFRIDGSLSSQFISALLIALPKLNKDSSLEIVGNYIVSYPYIQMTLTVLKKAGIRIKARNKRHYSIKAKQRFRGLKKFIVPSDYGLLAFLMAVASINKSHIILKISDPGRLIQPDKEVLATFKKMGVNFIKTKDKIEIFGPVKLKGGKFCLRDSPDLVPIMAVMALFAKDKTHIWGIEHVRQKESNRIADLTSELIKVGAKITEFKDGFLVHPCRRFRENVYLDPHQDHRLAMAFSVLATKTKLTIRDIDCVNKSYPNFLKDLRKIKVNFHKY